MAMQTETRVDLLLVTIIGCAALLAVALIAVAIASRHSLVAWQKFKSAVAVPIWVIPATAIVLAFGLFFAGVSWNPVVSRIPMNVSLLNQPAPVQLHPDVVTVQLPQQAYRLHRDMFVDSSGVIPIGILLLAVALITVVTVLISSRHSLVAWQKLKSALAVCVWVVPAAAIIVVLGLKFAAPRRAVPVLESHSAASSMAPVQRQQLMDSVVRSVEQNEPSADVQHGGGHGDDGQHVAAVASQEVHAADAHAANSHGGHSSHSGISTNAAPATVTERLHVRKMSSADPQWTDQSKIVKGRELIPLSSKRFATLAEAEADVTQMALARVQQQYRDDSSLGVLGAGQHELFVRLPGSAEAGRLASQQVLIDLIDRFAVDDLVGEVLDWDFGNGTKGKMYRAHLRLDLSSPFCNAVQVAAREDLTRHRLTIFGGMLGLVTLMFGTAAGYFQLDDATGGNYRRRLKLAAAALIAAGGLATAHVLGS